jgi:hypothetical protein
VCVTLTITYNVKFEKEKPLTKFGMSDKKLIVDEILSVIMILDRFIVEPPIIKYH